MYSHPVERQKERGPRNYTQTDGLKPISVMKGGNQSLIWIQNVCSRLASD